MIEEENASFPKIIEKLNEMIKNKEKYLKNMEKSKKNSANLIILNLIKKYEIKNNN